MDKTNGHKKTIAVILLAFVLYLPLTFLGFGFECGYYDSMNVIHTAKVLIQEHRYMPSRYPGSLIHELATTLLFMIGGNLLSNLGTLVMSLLTIYFFIKICEYHDIPHRHLLATFMVVNPLYYVASTFTIDYLWALGFLFIGYTLIIKRRYVAAGIFWALAIGSRMASVLFIAALLLAYLLTEEPNRHKVLLSACISAIIGAGFYIPSYLYVNHTFAFFNYGMGTWGWMGHLARFIYKNIYLWGLQTCIAFLSLSYLIIRGIKKGYELKYKHVILASILMIIVFEVMYFEVPGKEHYLLPILPFALMLVGISLKKYKWLLILLIVVQLSYNFININIAVPDKPNYATCAKIGLWLEPGYLIKDISERAKTNRLSFRP